MTSEPTPFERLIKLEHLVGELQAQLNPSTPRLEETAPPQRQLWPADELLLTRLIRRNPEVLRAYEAPAELIQTRDQGVLLTAMTGNSPFRLGELATGDAVVWLGKEHESSIYDTEIFRKIFIAPNMAAREELLVLQLLPRFASKSHGKDREWILESPGQMIPKSRPFVEQADQSELEQRIQRIEQAFARMRGTLDSELSSLRSHVQILQDQLDRLLRLRGDGQIIQSAAKPTPTEDDQNA